MITISLNLRQFKHQVITTPKGAKCLVIPIEENQFVDGEKGVYLNLAGFEIKDKKGDSKDTHLVKQSFKKEVYEKMTEDEKRNQPIIGNLTVWAGRQEAEPVASSVDPIASTDLSDLPF